MMSAILRLSSLLCLSLALAAQVRSIESAEVLRFPGSPFLGNPAARITIVEYSDFQCPNTASHAELTLNELVKRFVNTGAVKYVYRDWPNTATHPLSYRAAEAAHCAGEQGQFWGMHDRFLRNQSSIVEELLPKHAAMLRLNVSDFNACMDAKRYSELIETGRREAKGLGLSGTPGFAIGFTDPKDPEAFRPSFYIQGAQPLRVFEDVLKRLATSNNP